MAKIMLVGSRILAYAYLWEAFGAIYGSDVAEKTIFSIVFRVLCLALLGENRASVVIPQLLWFPRVPPQRIALVRDLGRRCIVGSWLDPFIIVVQSLHPGYMPSDWGILLPDVLGLGTVGRVIGLFRV